MEGKDVCSREYMAKQEVKERGQDPQILCKAACCDISPVKWKVSWPSASTILGTSEPTGHTGSIAVHKPKGPYVWSASEFIFSQTLVSWGLYNLIFLTYPTSSWRKGKRAGPSHLSTYSRLHLQSGNIRCQRTVKIKDTKYWHNVF